MDTMKRVLILITAAFLLAGCTVKEKEKEITVFHNTVNSIYTGEVKRKLPSGEGSAQLENNASVSGTFEKGTWISGEAGNVPYAVTLKDQNISGTYTGEVQEELPGGNGRFESDAFTYEGSWQNGEMDSGTVSAESFVIDTPYDPLEGRYSGEVKNGLAEGNGTFAWQEEEDEIQMEGSFLDNFFHGRLVKTIRHKDSERSYPVYYENGAPITNAVSLISYLEGMRKASYCLSEEQSSFIEDNLSLFEGQGTEPVTSAFAYSSFTEDSAPAWIKIENAKIKSVQRYKPYEGADPVTSMIVENEDGYYHLFFAWSVDEADEGETIDIIALPLCRSTLTAPEQDYPAIDAAGALTTVKQ